MSDGFAIQLSVRLGPNDSMINIRADDWQTFARTYTAVQPHLATLAAGKPLAGIDLIKSELGGEVIAEWDHSAPPMPPSPPAGPTVPQDWAAPPPWQQPAQVQQTYCQRCKKAPTCPTCHVGMDPTPKMINSKKGTFWLHEHPGQIRDHATVWCNEPKQ